MVLLLIEPVDVLLSNNRSRCLGVFNS